MQILNLTYLQPKTKTFIELLLITIILLSQQERQRLQPQRQTYDDTNNNNNNNKKAKKNYNEKPLIDIFVKVAHHHHPSLARGLTFFLKTVVANTDVAGEKSERDIVRWGCKVAVRVLNDE